MILTIFKINRQKKFLLLLQFVNPRTSDQYCKTFWANLHFGAIS